MAVKIPEYTIETKTNKRFRFTPIFIFLVFIIGALIGYLGSNFYIKTSLSSLQERNDFLDLKNLEYENTISSQLTEISILKTDQKVKKEAMLQLQSEYQELLGTIDNLKSDIGFYEQLLSPSDNKGLRVFNAIINEKSKSSFGLSLSLAQKIERAKTVSGTLKLTIEGFENDKIKTISVDMKQQSKFNFKYFQTFSYEISLPEGFKAERLVVKLSPSSKKAKTIHQSFNWDELIKETG